jgi:hypothetical protein
MNQDHHSAPLPADLDAIASHAPAFLDLWTPSQCRRWEQPKDYVLAGDMHITRGDITVIGGVAGCGKSRAVVGLAIAGATGQAWMGYRLPSRFKTLIVQMENGPARLQDEFNDIAAATNENLDDYIRITPPPLYGVPLHDEAFRDELREHIAEFRPGILAFDPWNRITADEKARDYRETLDAILGVLPSNPADRPAIVIVAHCRKQGSGDGKKRGRDLLPELSGSLVIGSAARSVFIVEHASADPEDDRIVLTCAKNNNGPEGPPSAWHRRNGLFVPCEEFDFAEFYGGGQGGKVKITEDHIRAALETPRTKTDAVKRLRDATRCGDSAAYAALADNGRFANLFDEAEGMLRLL